MLRNGVEIFPALLEAIEGADDTIEFETYVYWSGGIALRMATALADAARRGVEVRVLLDAVGSIPMDGDARRILDDSPAEVREFGPMARLKFWQLTRRTHRKILVCDDAVGFTGGVGIAEEWEGDGEEPGSWRESHFRIRGPAVRALRAEFFDHWCGLPGGEGGSLPDTLLRPGPGMQPGTDGNAEGDADVMVVPSRPSDSWARTRTIFRTLLRTADERVRICTAYFVPSPDLVDLLCDTSRRGVDVEILLPGPYIDFRVCQFAGEAVYDDLMDAGVRIWRYQPTMLHAKVATVDGQVSCIGSANLNHRSMQRDDELSLLVADTEFTARLDAHFGQDLERSEQVEPGQEWQGRGWVRKAAAHLSRMVRHEL
ncbi:MAG: phospholipase D-like domain-containing protein [Longimicrobiales bacterium]